jgi:hypothetical protein
VTGRVLLGGRRSFVPWLIAGLLALALVVVAVVYFSSSRSGISDAPTAGCESMAGQPPVTTASPLPTFEPGAAIEVVVHGRDYDEVQKTETDTILDRGCAITLVTQKPDPEFMVMFYRLPDGLVPVGAQIERIDTLVCGRVEGELWEVYGPHGSNPIEYENSQPSGSDGCWHFEGGDGIDSDVTLYIRDDTEWRVEEIRYTVTLVEATT